MQIADATGLVPSQVEQAGGGDVNAWNNCIPTAIMVCRAMYGLPVVDPQRETDGVYGRSYVGGESFLQAEAWVEANVGPAPGPVLGGVDLAAMDAALAARYAVIGFFHCDANATINSEGPFYHASIVLDHQPDDWHVLNVHDYSEHHYGQADMAAFTRGAGGFVYYQTPLPGATGDDDMPVQSWVLAPRYFQPGDRPIYVPDVNCDKDDLFVSVAGCDEGDGSVGVIFTDGTNPSGPPLASATASFTKSDDAVVRQASGVVRVVLEPPTAPCWVAVKVQKKGA